MVIVISLRFKIQKTYLCEGLHEIRGFEIRVEHLQNWNRYGESSRGKNMGDFLCAVFTDWKFEFN